MRRVDLHKVNRIFSGASVFARPVTFVIFSSLAVQLLGQTGGPTPASDSDNRGLQSQAVYYSFCEIHSPSVRQAIWQSSEVEQWAETTAESEPVQQQNQDLEKRRQGLAEQKSTTRSEQSESDDYRLPRLASVRDPIAAAPLSSIRQKDPSNLLDKESDQQAGFAADHMSYANLTGTMPYPAAAHWAAPNFYHRPLLFEETNLERYGNKRCFQNFRSAAHFLGTIPVLPYKLGKHGRRYRDYTLRHHRPGNCVPYEVDRFQFDAHGGFWQALVTAAVVIP